MNFDEVFVELPFPELELYEPFPIDKNDPLITYLLQIKAL
jgi:hypothetical protein